MNWRIPPASFKIPSQGPDHVDKLEHKIDRDLIKALYNELPAPLVELPYTKAFETMYEFFWTRAKARNIGRRTFWNLLRSVPSSTPEVD